jgi:hypothetical protein
MKTGNKQYDDGIFKAGVLNIPRRNSLENMLNGESISFLEVMNTIQQIINKINIK